MYKSEWATSVVFTSKPGRSLSVSQTRSSQDSGHQHCVECWPCPVLSWTLALLSLENPPSNCKPSPSSGSFSSPLTSPLCKDTDCDMLPATSQDSEELSPCESPWAVFTLVKCCSDRQVISDNTIEESRGASPGMLFTSVKCPAERTDSSLPPSVPFIEVREISAGSLVVFSSLSTGSFSSENLPRADCWSSRAVLHKMGRSSTLPCDDGASDWFGSDSKKLPACRELLSVLVSTFSTGMRQEGFGTWVDGWTPLTPPSEGRSNSCREPRDDRRWCWRWWRCWPATVTCKSWTGTGRDRGAPGWPTLYWPPPVLPKLLPQVAAAEGKDGISLGALAPDDKLLYPGDGVACTNKGLIDWLAKWMAHRLFGWLVAWMTFDQHACFTRVVQSEVKNAQEDRSGDAEGR